MTKSSLPESLRKFFDPARNDCAVIAEVAQSHEGSLGQAHAFIDAAADAGADAIKFQTHIADAESTPDEPFRVKFSKQDKNRYDYWKRMEFREEEWVGLADHARERGLIFLSTPFSVRAVELLERIGVPAWKVGSGEAALVPFLEKLISTGKPILLSSGMSSWDEIEKSVALIQKGGNPLALFQATTMYPTPAEHVGLNVIGELQKRFRCPVGLSDHSGTIFPGLAAVALGARFVEVHVALSKRMFGPDVVASVSVEELAELARGVRFLEKARANPVDKDAKAGELAELKNLFGRSVVPARDLSAGTKLTESDLTLKKPGKGIPANELPSLLGRRLKRAVKRDEFFGYGDLEE